MTRRRLCSRAPTPRSIAPRPPVAIASNATEPKQTRPRVFLCRRKSRAANPRVRLLQSARARAGSAHADSLPCSPNKFAQGENKVMAARQGLCIRPLSLCVAAALVSLGAHAAPAHAIKHGTLDLGEWTDAVKTDHGKEARRYHAVYDWDTGLTHEYAYALDGRLVSERSYRGAPPASPAEVDEAK